MRFVSPETVWRREHTAVSQAPVGATVFRVPVHLRNLI